MWWEVLGGVVAGLVLFWLVLVVVLWRTKPDQAGLRDALRLLPDLIRLLRRLAADPVLPRRVRVGLALLLGYLPLPIDLIPDFIPVLATPTTRSSSRSRCAPWSAAPDPTRWPSTGPAPPRACTSCIDSRSFRPPPDQRTRGDDPGAVIAAQ